MGRVRRQREKLESFVEECILLHFLPLDIHWKPCCKYQHHLTGGVRILGQVGPASHLTEGCSRGINYINFLHWQCPVCHSPCHSSRHHLSHMQVIPQGRTSISDVWQTKCCSSDYMIPVKMSSLFPYTLHTCVRVTHFSQVYLNITQGKCINYGWSIIQEKK